MRKLLMAAGLAASVATATAAMTQPALARNYCEAQKHQDRVTGTILGGVIGALAGQAISHGTGGTLLGAGAGAVAGNAIAASRDPKCDRYWGSRGYYWDDRQGAYRYYGRNYYRNRPYYNNGYYDNGYYNNGYYNNGYYPH